MFFYVFLQLIMLFTNLQKRKYTAISINIKKEICEYIIANPYVK